MAERSTSTGAWGSRGFARGLTAALGAVGLLVACSSSSSNASSASGFAQQYCALIEPCCADAGLPTSGQACNALLGSGLGGTYNATAGQACLDATRAASSQPNFCTSPPSCKNVFSSSGGSSGNLQPGQSCMSDSDCIPASGTGGSAYCYYGFAGDGGTSQVCLQTLPGKAGQGPCVATQTGNGTSYSWQGSTPLPSLGYVCNTADGVACDYSTKQCKALAATGGTCSTDVDCVATDYCNYAAGSGEACAPRQADGASCAGALSNACMLTSNCDTTTQKCVAGLPTGASCTSGEPCASRICANGKCSSSSNFGLALLCGS